MDYGCSWVLGVEWKGKRGCLGSAGPGLGFRVRALMGIGFVQVGFRFR